MDEQSSDEGDATTPYNTSLGYLLGLFILVKQILDYIQVPVSCNLWFVSHHLILVYIKILTFSRSRTVSLIFICTCVLSSSRSGLKLSNLSLIFRFVQDWPGFTTECITFDVLTQKALLSGLSHNIIV